MKTSRIRVFYQSSIVDSLRHHFVGLHVRLLLSYPYIMRVQNRMTKTEILSFLDVMRSPGLFLIIVISLISPVHIALLSASLSPAMFVERDCLRSTNPHYFSQDLRRTTPALPSPGVTRPPPSFSVESSGLSLTWSRSKVTFQVLFKKLN